MALILRNISKIYGPVHALDDVSLTVEPGECRALYGGNGSGKSTTARIVSGSVTASSGSVEIDGRALDAPSPRRARAMGIGITFQELSLLSDLTVAENVVIGDAPRYSAFLSIAAVCVKPPINTLPNRPGAFQRCQSERAADRRKISYRTGQRPLSQAALHRHRRTHNDAACFRGRKSLPD